MRPSLLPGLLAAAARNAARGAESDPPVRDRPALSGGRRAADSGPRPRRSARAPALARQGGAVDAYDAKAEALAILAAAGAPVDNLQVLGEASAVYHPGQSGGSASAPKNALAEFGALHPGVAKAFDLDGPVVAAEIFLDAIPQKRGADRPYAQRLSRRRRCRR